MKGFRIIMEQRLKILEDFEKNKEKYFKNIKGIASKYGGFAKIFGSYLEKEKFFGGSDVDVLVVIPGIEKNRSIKWKVLRELKESVNENPRFEFHVVDKKGYEIYSRFIKKFEDI